MKANKKVNNILTELALVQLTIEQSDGIPTRQAENAEMLRREKEIIKELITECARLEYSV